MPKDSPSVNLIKTKSIVLDQFVDWALNVGRLLVIITELVALTMFVYRFSLDRQIIDLKDKISQEDSIVAALKPKEISYRDLQTRINLAGSLITAQENETKTLDLITSSSSQGIIFNNLTVTPTTINLTASSQSVSSLKSLVDTLKKSSLLNSVNVNNINNNASTALLKMDISANTKTQIK